MLDWFIDWIGTWQWGDVPSIFTGGVAVAALLYARRAARAAAGQLRVARTQIYNLEREADEQYLDRKEQYEEKERAQAAQVSVWMDNDGTGFRGYYVNFSGSPVYDVTVDVHAVSVTGPPLRYPVLSPTQHVEELPTLTEALREFSKEDKSFFRYWRAGVTDISLVPNGEINEEEGWQELEMIVPVGPVVTFTDANGLRWHRQTTGHLRRVDPHTRTVNEKDDVVPPPEKVVRPPEDIEPDRTGRVPWWRFRRGARQPH